MKIRFAKKCSAEVCVKEKSVAQISRSEVRLAEVCCPQIRPTKVRTYEDCRAEVRFTKIHPKKVRLTKICTTEIRPVEIRTLYCDSHPPLIPSGHPLFDDGKLFGIGHKNKPITVPFQGGA